MRVVVVTTENKTAPETPDPGAHLRDIIRRNRSGDVVGVCAVCSAHPELIATAAGEARANNSILHVESTSSQVNQHGGYAGQTPEQFAGLVRSITQNAGLSSDRVLLGGDHLGPFPWRREPVSLAMHKAHALVRACVLAGYQKIHLDASMACSDESAFGLDERTVAERAAALCETAENAFRELPVHSPPLLYVVGTEVPAPGGESSADEALSVTPASHVQSTLRAFQLAFAEHGLENAWERVIGLVVQPGVEFGEWNVFDYDRGKAASLSLALPASPQLVYEAHSTDFQLATGLRQLVEDHFAILKVGPELTFAFREAIFALCAIEHEMLRTKAEQVSRVREALEAAMLRNPSYWRDYCHGDENELRISRFYSYSDRCRYYWFQPELQAQVELLMKNLNDHPPALTLVSQYLPQEYDAIRAGVLRPLPSHMIRHHIAEVLHKYAKACGQT
jgi:D-tagatose-1,6-bisphosphate aldolase subunit GatZ/KbaZ